MQIGVGSETMDGYQGTQASSELRAHVVLVTIGRRGVLSHDAVQDLRAIFARVCEDFKAKLVRCSGQDDHVHLLVSYPPRISLSNLVSNLKSVSTRLNPQASWNAPGSNGRPSSRRCVVVAPLFRGVQ